MIKIKIKNVLTRAKCQLFCLSSHFTQSESAAATAATCLAFFGPHVPLQAYRPYAARGASRFLPLPWRKTPCPYRGSGKQRLAPIYRVPFAKGV